MTRMFNESQNLGRLSRGVRLPDVSQFARFGKLEHDVFMDEIARQNQNRTDFIVDPGQGRFEGINFTVGNQSFPLDPISMTTLAERFKQGKGHTITRKGLAKLMHNPDLFEEVGNFFLRQIDKPIKFRSLYNTGIAFPSKDYTIINHADLMGTTIETLTQVFGQRPTTINNYMDKSIAYSFIPLPDAGDILIRNFKGYEDRIGIGVEMRNSEILEHAVTVNFKMIRFICSNGLIFGEEIGSVYQKHIRLTSNELLGNVQTELLTMFQDNIDGVYDTLETLKRTLELRVSNGEAYTREFGRMLDMDERGIQKLIEVGHIEEDDSLYGWTIGPLSYLASNRTNNRFLQAANEAKAGQFLSSPEMRDRLLSMLD